MVAGGPHIAMPTGLLSPKPQALDAITYFFHSRTTPSLQREQEPSALRETFFRSIKMLPALLRARSSRSWFNISRPGSTLLKRAWRKVHRAGFGVFPYSARHRA